MTTANGSGGTPDLRDRFVRGVGDNSGAPGAVQENAIRNITGTFDTGSMASLPSSAGNTFNITRVDGLAFDASRVVPATNEKRPINVALLACIKSCLQTWKTVGINEVRMDQM